MLKSTLVFCCLISSLLPRMSNLHPENIPLKHTVFGIAPLIFADFFSPNDDGHNDMFVIQNLDEYPINKLHVFNRWGEQIFEGEPYLNNWDGTINIKGQLLGKPVPDGTYFYRFEYTIGDFITRRNGKILLKR